MIKVGKGRFPSSSTDHDLLIPTRKQEQLCMRCPLAFVSACVVTGQDIEVRHSALFVNASHLLIVGLRVCCCLTQTKTLLCVVLSDLLCKCSHADIILLTRSRGEGR